MEIGKKNPKKTKKQNIPLVKNGSTKPKNGLHLPKNHNRKKRPNGNGHDNLEYMVANIIDPVAEKIEQIMGYNNKKLAYSFGKIYR